MKTYTIYQVDSFTKELFRGNPAGVVPDADGLTEQQMQDIARELNNSETAFILSPTSSDHDVWVRFFTPATEVPSCGHATIAAHYVRAKENRLESCTVHQKIGIGILPVECVKKENDYEIIMTQGKVEIDEPLDDEIRDKIVSALDLTNEDRDERCPVQIVSTGHSKVMVGIRSKEKLNAIQPDLSALVKISTQINCKGYFVFTFDSDDPEILTHGRMFAPAIGITEDPVTGNANGPLGAYMVHKKLVEHNGSLITFKGQQGEAIGRTGTVNVTVKIENDEPVQVKVGGNAVVVFKTEITI